MSENNSEDKVYIDLKKVPLKSEREEKARKNRFIILNVLIVIGLVSLGFLGGILYNKAIHPTSYTRTINTLGEIEAVMDKYWLYSNEYDDLKTELEDKAFYGMTLFEDDPYTTYMSKEELEEFRNSINMDYVGVGVVYKLQNDSAIVERVILNSPAQEAGIKAGDIITKIDGNDIKGLSTAEIKEMVLGKKDTTVSITVVRDNEVINFDVVRGQVDNSVYCHTQDDYIIMELYSFGVNTNKECISYLDQLRDYKKIIIDIRGNTGGYQSSVENICGLFIGNKQVYLKQEDVDGNMKEALTRCGKSYDFDSIVILTNENTASAAEVFAICLKEQLDNVTLVGTTTFGKGVIQSNHGLANGGALKFTSYNWYSPNGNSINGVGIVPDEEVKLADAYYEKYAPMDEDETYEYDSVGDVVRLTQKCLVYLDYYNGRTDGYYGEGFAEAIKTFKSDNGLDADAILDKPTYDAVVSKIFANLSNKVKDYQMSKAIEIISK